ncbi:uncharacterized protein DUF697 [Asanoa ferruginea]|uniref:Uncharacterized protein DUF697 n=2 Tax=Asanoa ferruginea TaxID=53367 RepID=A0A3D9ZNS4_9ACTN|nr:uncharacterized protein DUF697 [Asanoa ferruginea]GIF46288.1 hypothetical protein Afe04nite_08270 [Asanoa ferruginea]
MAESSDHSDFDRIMAAARLAYEEQLREIGTFNLAVFGDTGVGKSELINAIFGIETAKTGRGDAQTVKLERHRRTTEDPLTIYDNVGFVTGGGSTEELAGTIRKIVTDLRLGPQEAWIHVVWFVHNPLTNRFTKEQGELISAIHEMGLPVMLVLTHAAKLGDAVMPAVAEVAADIAGRGLPLAANGRVFMVNSIAMPQLGGPTLPAQGLDELLEATIRLVPSAAAAINAVQRLDLSVQRKEAIRILRNYRKVAVGAGAGAVLPVPAADLVGLGVTLAAMIAKISATYALPIRKQQLLKVTAIAVVGVTGMHGAAVKGGVKVAERVAVKQAAKESGMQLGRYVPGANVIVGTAGAVSAAGLTTAAAHAWMRVCEYLLARPRLMRTVDDPTLLDLFRTFYQRRKSAPPEGLT